MCFDHIRNHTKGRSYHCLKKLSKLIKISSLNARFTQTLLCILVLSDTSQSITFCNNDLTFIAERGTVSSFIGISFDYPCALNLTLIPYTFGFVFIPTQIQISTGMMQEYFRVSVSDTVDDTLYVINWEIIGEVTPNYYTPITSLYFS